MRSKLDEIVEEFYRKAGPGGFLDARGLSMACFRHGVDQAWRSTWTIDSGKIQPAPAAEKTRFENLSFETARCKCGCGDSVRAHLKLDRRKGQRRKEGNWWPENYVHGWQQDDGTIELSRRIYQQSPDGSFMYDRRSGNERRKP